MTDLAVPRQRTRLSTLSLEVRKNLWIYLVLLPPFVLLTVLAQQGDATQQELVRLCYSDTATIGTMLSLLEQKGRVTRTPHPEDGRALSVRLTPSGRRLAEKMRQSSSGLRTELATLFTEAELGTLIEFLNRLAGAMHPPARKTTLSRSRRLQHAGK